MTDDKVELIQAELRAFTQASGQKYPWRFIDDPYRIIVSEFMLHRTQARQVIPVYKALTQAYPTLKTFSEENGAVLRSILKPLGLNWRINSMIEALKFLYDTYSSIPLEVSLLSEVKGIGPYIAGATVCFTLDVPEVLVDVNTIRVTGRLLGLNLTGEARRRKQNIEGLKSLVPDYEPRRFFYGLIDLAHRFCKSGKPLCSNCPLHNTGCIYYLDSQQLC